jgi:hypothetical protein
MIVLLAAAAAGGAESPQPRKFLRAGANRIAGDPMTAFQSRFGLLYAKGPYVLYTLHKELGDDQFLTFLKSYQKSRRWKFSSTAEAASLLQFITKKDYGPWFEENFYGTGFPDVKLK